MTVESKHTPGLYARGPLYHDWDGVMGGHVVRDSRDNTVAMCGGARDDANALACAQVFAAAPDMLKALIAILEWIPSRNARAGSDRRKAYYASEGMAREAIAKAIGETAR
jgi:hypothetical protein